jgi:ABC-type sugar transport system substrate-binding protein
MNPMTTRRMRATSVVLAAVGMLAAGCGSSSSTASPASSATTAAAAAATSASAPTSAAAPTTAAATSAATSASAAAATSAPAPSATSGSAPSAAAGSAQQVNSTSGGSCTSATYAGGVTKLDTSNPGSITIGFAQSEATSNPFRATETKSITAAAKAAGYKLIQTNANGSGTQENTDIENLLNRGAQFLIVAPEDSTSESAAIAQAKAKKVPVLTIDRTVNGTACSDFVGFIGSNFTGQAKIAADDLGAALSGKGNVAILEGSTGNNVALARTSGFKAEISAKFPNIKIVADQTANFDLATGQKVMAQFLQSKTINGVYAENDEMALGALSAIKQAGKTAGTTGSDIRIVSIDGVREFVQDVANGIAVADVETNPRFGPLAFAAIKNFYGTTGVPATTIITDHHFTKANAAKSLTNGDVY